MAQTMREGSPAAYERGLMLVYSNPSASDQREAFNRWYDEVHLQEVLQVPGVVAASRFQYDDDQMLPGDNPLGRNYLAVYEIEAEDLQQVRDTMLATSADRTHSDSLELEPLPVIMIFKQLGDKISR